MLHLSADDARLLAGLLGGNHVSESVIGVQQQLEGLAIEWVAVMVDSTFVGATIGHGQFRTRTGAGWWPYFPRRVDNAAPGPDVALQAADVVVAVGTPDGLELLRELLTG